MAAEAAREGQAGITAANEERERWRRERRRPGREPGRGKTTGDGDEIDSTHRQSCVY